MQWSYIITVRNSSCGKIMFSQACVKNSVQGGVHPLPPRQTGRHPLGRPPHPLGRHPPPGRHLPPPQGRSLLRRPLQRTVRILLECILVFNDTIISNIYNWNSFLDKLPANGCVTRLAKPTVILITPVPMATFSMVNTETTIAPSNPMYAAETES